MRSLDVMPFEDGKMEGSGQMQFLSQLGPLLYFVVAIFACVCTQIAVRVWSMNRVFYIAVQTGANIAMFIMWYFAVRSVEMGATAGNLVLSTVVVLAPFFVSYYVNSAPLYKEFKTLLEGAGTVTLRKTA